MDHLPGRRDWTRGIASLLFMVVLTEISPAQLFNRFPPVGQQGDDAAASDLSNHLPVNHVAYGAYFNAKSAIEQGKVVEGLEALQSILDGSTDFLIRDEQQARTSLVQQIQDILQTHQAEYQRLFGDQAQQLLETALSQQDTLAIGEVVRRFSLTDAGGKAFQLSVALNLDLGQINPPAAMIDRIDISVKNAVQEFKESIEPASAATGADWVTPFGTPANSTRSSFAPAILADAWQHSRVDEFDFFLGNSTREQELLKRAQSLFQAVQKRFVERPQRMVFPAGRPLIVNNVVIVPGFSTPKAFDLETGELLGVGIKEDETFKYLFSTSAAPGFEQDPIREDMQFLFTILRGWRDLTSASMSTDGTYVYAITDCQLVGSTHPAHLARSSNRHELLPQNFNQLHAYEIASGLRNRWSVGAVDDQAMQPFAGNPDFATSLFFYGAPLPVNGQLFVIAEDRGEIQLLELDRETGQTLWSIGLLGQQQKLVTANERRIAGLMPAFVNGLLICPTGEGVITAIDPVRRTIAWTHQYAPIEQQIVDQFAFRGAPPQFQEISETIVEFTAHDRWFDARIVATQDALFFTPPDADELVALNISDGSPIWEEPISRLRMQSIATLFEHDLVFAGENSLMAIDTESGARHWTCPIATPSGRGVRMGEMYLQPLETGEIAFVDLRSGRLIARSLVAGGEPIGNLVAAHGHLIALDGTTVRAFQTESKILERLAALPESSPERQALLGELELQHNHPEVLDKLMQIDPELLPDRTKNLLGWALIERLKSDFQPTNEDVAKIERLLITPQQRFEFSRSLALSFEKSERVSEAFRKYLQMLNQTQFVEPVQGDSGEAEISAQRWILSRVESILNQSSEEQRVALKARLQDWLMDESTSDESALSVLRSVTTNSIGFETVLTKLQEMSVNEESSPTMWLVCESLIDAASETNKARVLALLTEIALKSGDGSSAENVLRQLTELGDARVNTDQTALEFVEATRANPEWSEMFHLVPHWPVHGKKTDSVNPVESYQRYQLPILGPSPFALNGWSFFLDQMGVYIDIYDQHGRRRWRVPTGISSRYQNQMGASLGRYVSLHGQQALIVLADRFLLIDCHADQDAPHVVMSQELSEQVGTALERRVFFPRMEEPRPGLRGYVTLSQQQSGYVGNVGPLLNSYFCYGFENQLRAVDPLTGALLWQRQDLEPGSEILGDENYVLTKHPLNNQLRIFSALDGTFLKEQSIPNHVVRTPLARHFGDWGRLLPLAKQQDNQLAFEMYDPVKNEPAWSFTTDSPTIWSVLDGGKKIAFLSAGGEFVVRDAESGEQLLKSDVPVAGLPDRLNIVTRGENWILCPGDGAPDFYHFSYSSPTTSALETTVDGPVTAVNRLSGEISWTMEIPDQKFVIQTPSAWPILFFAGSRGGEIELLVMNHVTGEEILKERFSLDSSLIRWKASVQPLLIQIGVGRNTVGIAFEEILEPSAPPQSE